MGQQSVPPLTFYQIVGCEGVALTELEGDADMLFAQIVFQHQMLQQPLSQVLTHMQLHAVQKIRFNRIKKDKSQI